MADDDNSEAVLVIECPPTLPLERCDKFFLSILEQDPSWTQSLLEHVYKRSQEHLLPQLYREDLTPTLSEDYFWWRVERYMWRFIFRGHLHPPAFPYREPPKYGPPYSMHYLIQCAKSYVDRLHIQGDYELADSICLRVTESPHSQIAWLEKFQEELGLSRAQKRANELRDAICGDYYGQYMSLNEGDQLPGTMSGDCNEQIAQVLNFVADIEFRCVASEEHLKGLVGSIADSIAPFCIAAHIEATIDTENQMLEAMETLESLVMDETSDISKLLDRYDCLEHATHVLMKKTSTLHHHRISEWNDNVSKRITAPDAGDHE